MKNNKLIAEFMGATLHENGTYQHHSLPMYVPLSNMEYKTSWDWLMPVLLNISELSQEEDYIIDYFQGFGDPHIWFSGYGKMCIDLDISGVYEDLVRFINWYNHNNL